MEPNCGSCSLMAPEGYCKIFQQQIDNKEKICCPKYSATSYTCDICHRSFFGSLTLVPIKGKYYSLCQECAENSHNCRTCKFSMTCDFETSNSPLPKMVQKQMRQGNQVMITTVKNEERIKATCEMTCKCYSKEQGCLRECGACASHKLPIEE